jgi:hypothetical protein
VVTTRDVTTLGDHHTRLDGRNSRVQTKIKALLPAGALAAVILAACTVPPPTKPPVKPPSTTKPPATTPAAPPCPTPAANSTPGPDTKNPISSWGVDGLGYTSVVIGNIVYVGGSFTHAVSPSGAKIVRTNLAAFCVANGAPPTGWVANVDGPVYALTTDGTNLFVGGNFSHLNGVAVNHLVKLSAYTGARITSFNPPAIPSGKPVYALDYFGGKVYAGGDFSVGSPIVGKKGASFNSTSGAFAGWNPNADAAIQALKVSPDGLSVFIGGTFSNVGGQAHNDLARTSTSNGAVSSATFGNNANCDPGNPSAVLCGHVLSIAVASNSSTIFVSTGPSRPKGSGGGNKLYSFSAAGGAPSWQKSFDGDDQAVVVIGSTVYTGFHGGYGCNQATDPGCKLRVLGFSTGGTQTSFNPTSSGVLGVRGLAVGANRLVAVGDFSNMGSTNKLHGVAIFN